MGILVYVSREGAKGFAKSGFVPLLGTLSLIVFSSNSSIPSHLRGFA